MAETLKIQINSDQLKQVVRMFHDLPGGAKKATVRAINRTLMGARTDAVNEIGMRLNLSLRRIRQDFSIHNASFATMSASLKASGKPVSLTTFSGTRQVNKGVSVMVLKTRGRKVLKHAFIQKSHNSKQAFYRDYHGDRQKNRVKRVSKNFVGPTRPQFQYARMPLEYRYPGRGFLIRLHGPRIEDIYARPQITGAVLYKAGVRLTKRLDHEANYLLSKYKEKAAT